MLSKLTINDKKIYMTHCRTLINNDFFKFGEITLAEYNIDDISKANIDEQYFYCPKTLFLSLLPFMIKIIRENETIDKSIKTIYNFGVKQHNPFQNPHDKQVISKEIEVEIEFDTPVITIGELIKTCIDNMDQSSFLLDEDIQNGLSLTVVKIELFKERRNSIIANFNTYKEDTCVVCINNKPNILFCNCGHLIVCDKCFDKLENNKCPKCRKINKIIRKI